MGHKNLRIFFPHRGQWGKYEHSRQSLQDEKTNFMGKIESQKTKNKRIQTIFARD